MVSRDDGTDPASHETPTLETGPQGRWIRKETLGHPDWRSRPDLRQHARIRTGTSWRCWTRVRGRERRRFEGGLADLCSDASTVGSEVFSERPTQATGTASFMTAGDPDSAQCISSRER